ncbi:MAG: T9SS type A sorting domain-containing protein [bacterium]|nr:T9SS type A sorting domain-containing protein [bacterium]
MRRPAWTRCISRSWLIFVNDAPEAPLPLAFELKPLYPNPFNGAVNISFTLPRASGVSLKVFDVLGREVGEIASGVKQAGLHNTQWNCAECAAGIYLFKLDAAGQTFVQKAAYVK